MPDENARPYDDDPLIEALRRRAPETHRKGWYSEVADGIGCDDYTVKRWFYGKVRPSTDQERALYRFFGCAFADEVIHALYGWHVTENGTRTNEQIQEAQDWLSQAPDWMQGNVTKLRRA